jgi:hypothetical protein
VWRIQAGLVFIEDGIDGDELMRVDRGQYHPSAVEVTLVRQ